MNKHKLKKKNQIGEKRCDERHHFKYKSYFIKFYDRVLKIYLVNWGMGSKKSRLNEDSKANSSSTSLLIEGFVTELGFTFVKMFLFKLNRLK